MGFFGYNFQLFNLFSKLYVVFLIVNFMHISEIIYISAKTGMA